VGRKPVTTAIIEIRLGKLQQLFNSLDPSPFHDKDLDQNAHDYIVGSADEHPLQRPLKLVIIMPQEELRPDDIRILQDAIHNYFAYRLREARQRIRFMLRDGRVALAIGLAFLIACTSLRQLIISTGSGAVSHMISEGFLILGWVAMWRPIQIFLYDWWPIKRMARLFAKLSTVTVEVKAG